MDDHEVLQRALGEVVSSVNMAFLVLKRAAPLVSLVGIEQRQETDRLIAVLREVEDDIMVLLDEIETQTDYNP